MLNLEDKEWKDFRINTLFEVSGTTTTHPSKLIKNGFIPRITCSSTNNGLDNIYLNEATESGGVLTVDSATIGYIAYQQRDFIATDHVEKIFIKDKRINRDLGLGLVTCIRNSTLNKFNYGYKFSQDRIRKQKIILPINKNKEPDFEYMEEYSKSIINCKTEKYKQYAQKVLNSIKYKNIETLENKDWKEFFISGENGLFSITSTSSGIDKNKLVFSNNGKIPYITRSDLNNGINLYLENNQIPKYKIDNGNVITIGLDTQTVFYQPYSFFTGQNIQILRHNKLNKYNSLFLIPLIKIQMQKFNWGGNGATLGRLSKTKIMLPVNSKDEPDFEYMEQYMKNITHNKIKQYLDYLEKS
ncbi:restriction endonuclease subunit S [Aliarcobacter cryaerophilus]|uniref:restriction endonuclease subunit S n=1 Tax=Aliarcobacter cryaerophilus TaxID=28198 RepID=UPI003BB05CCB